MSYEIADKQWSLLEFAEWLEKQPRPTWAKGVTLHHTAFPDLKMRPLGFTPQHQKNLRHYYEEKLGWSDGPHLFVDDYRVTGMSGLQDDGVHAVGFNRTHIGIEVLGSYDKGADDPRSGRGLMCWENAGAVVHLLLEWLGLDDSYANVTFHREDGYTSKTCPGSNISHSFVQGMIDQAPLKLELAPTAPRKTVADDDNDGDDVSQPQPRVPGWDDYRLIEGGWFVPVYRFMTHLSGDAGAVLSKFRAVEGKFYYDGDLIRNMFFDHDDSETWALASEILGLTE